MANDPHDVGLMPDSDQTPTSGPMEPLQPARRLSLLERILPLPSLPAYNGPHNVGTLDVEFPARRPKTVGQLKRLSDGADALRIDTVLATIFYPTEAKKGKRLPWLAKPRTATASGYARFAGVSTWLLTPIALLFASFVRLPAYLNAPLLRKDEDKGKRKLILFSHGLAGNRAVYSQYCGELASRGHIVAAVEHRDGSGPSSFVHHADKQTGARHVPFYKAEDITEETRLPPMDMRRLQVEQRVAEVQELFHFMRELNSNGTPQQLCESRASSRAQQVDWADWKDSMDAEEDVVLTGHSFGGATVVHALRSLPDELLSSVSHAVALDPWLEPLPAIKSPSTRRIPILAINSPGFTRWDGNFFVVKRIISQTGGILATLGGSVHTSFSDFPVLMPRITRLRRRKSPKIDPRRAIDICAASTIAFAEDKVQTSPLDTSRGAKEAAEGDELNEPGQLYLHIGSRR